MLTVGLTGGIGTGKTEVCRILEELGARILNADTIAREITETDFQVIQQIKAQFGEHTYSPEGSLKRKALGRHVFSDPQALETLNHIIHPKMIQKIRDAIRQHQRKYPNQLLVVEVAIMYEIGLEKEFDLVVVVSAPIETVVKRLVQRDGVPQNEVMQRIQSQLPQAEKEKRADIILRNDGNLGTMRKKVEQLYHAIVQHKIPKKYQL